MINIDPEASDHQSQQQPQSRPNSNVSQKSMTLGDLTDSIISNDFNNSTCGYPLTFRSNCNVPYSQDNIASSEQWKLRRSVQQKEIADRDKNSRSNTPDERQVIRISQPVDARSGKQTQHVSSYHEPVAGQTNERVYGNKSSGSSSQQRLPKPPAKHISAFDYVTNRIVEVMRTEDDNKRLNIEEQEIKQQDISKSELKEQDRCSTPGEMVIDETSDTSATKLDTISSCPNQSSVQVTTTYPSTAYNYPFGAHNVSSQGTQQITKSVNIDIAQPKPLLSAQYEPLSDED